MVLPTFITTPGLSYISGKSVRSTCRRAIHAPPSARPAQRGVITMEEATKKKKKATKLTFAVDIKGNFVWNLRSATVEDVSAISALIPQLPSSIVESLVEDSPCCVVCEASVKGAKEGEGYSGRILGAALVDVSLYLKNESVTKTADFITVVADSVLPDVEAVKKKLVLGSLKKCKENSVAEVSSEVSADNVERVELLENCLFKIKTKDASGVRLSCRLAAENPDPQKKMT